MAGVANLSYLLRLIGNHDQPHQFRQTLRLPQPRPRRDVDRRHQAQSAAQAAPAAGGAGSGAPGRHHLAVHRRQRRSGGAERAVQPLLAADHSVCRVRPERVKDAC